MNEVIKVEDCGSNIGDYDVPIHTAIIIPKNGTNGDVIKAVFPDCIIADFDNKHICCAFDMFEYEYFNKKWWNAPYKADKESKT